LQDAIAAHVGLLEEVGPSLGRPYADTLRDTSIANLKELRVQHQGQPYRILFAFDPRREALLLLGGNKAGDKRWYRKAIPRAEAIIARHLEELEDQDG
jgi:hypothetical protein